MITCNLAGGLGNQLFQIFATIAYALENNKPFGFLDCESLDNGCTQRHTYWNSFLSSLKKCTHKTISQMHIVTEEGFNYSKLKPLQENTDIMLDGYFQSYKYFQSYFNSICRFIKLDKTKEEVFNKYLYNYSDISMHFRLGDYKNLTDYHPVLEYEYYEKALEYIINNMRINTIDNINVLYFCEKEDNDDVNLKISRLHNKFKNVTFIKAHDNIVDWEQMILMSCCKHNIIANSTFSWWGAYFNSNPDKIVCYPDTWFGPALSHIITDDLFPDDWHKIQM